MTKGVHVVVDLKRFPLKQAVYFDTPYDDGRMMFAIPRGGKVYIGTTDTNYHGEQSNPDVTEKDVDYIIQATNALFPKQDLTESDVESSWAACAR